MEKIEVVLLLITAIEAFFKKTCLLTSSAYNRVLDLAWGIFYITQHIGRLPGFQQNNPFMLDAKLPVLSSLDELKVLLYVSKEKTLSADIVVM